jgi:hypothetical protein
MDVLLMVNLIVAVFCFALAFRAYDNFNNRMDQIDRGLKRFLRDMHAINYSNMHQDGRTNRRDKSHLTLLKEDDADTDTMDE